MNQDFAEPEALDYKYLVYVGTYTGQGSEGIYAYRFDPDPGESVSIGLAASTDNPSFLAVDPEGKYLYAVNEIEKFKDQATGAVSAFEIDQQSGRLNLLQQVSSLGAGPAHLSLDKSARYLMVANYNSGNYAVFPIGKDGRLGSHTAFVQDAGSSVNLDRQAGPHAHSIQVTNDNRFAIVADLGLDKLLLYRFNEKAGSLKPGSPEFVTVDPGAGPRHVGFAPSGRFLYVVNEMASTVMAFAYNPERGTLLLKQTTTVLPRNFTGINTAGEIAVDANGKFLYVSNRGDDSIVVFRINPEDGTLSPIEWIPTGGKNPRHFVIDPTGKWLFVANQDSNNIKLFRIDPGSGQMTPTSRTIQVASPVCVSIFSVK